MQHVSARAFSPNALMPRMGQQLLSMPQATAVAKPQANDTLLTSMVVPAQQQTSPHATKATPSTHGKAAPHGGRLSLLG
jgi:hypothetical protein